MKMQHSDNKKNENVKCTVRIPPGIVKLNFCTRPKAFRILKNEESDVLFIRPSRNILKFSVEKTNSPICNEKTHEFTNNKDRYRFEIVGDSAIKSTYIGQPEFLKCINPVEIYDLCFKASDTIILGKDIGQYICLHVKEICQFTYWSILWQDIEKLNKNNPLREMFVEYLYSMTAVQSPLSSSLMNLSTFDQLFRHDFPTIKVRVDLMEPEAIARDHKLSELLRKML